MDAETSVKRNSNSFSDKKFLRNSLSVLQSANTNPLMTEEKEEEEEIPQRSRFGMKKPNLSSTFSRVTGIPASIGRMTLGSSVSLPEDEFPTIQKPAAINKNLTTENKSRAATTSITERKVNSEEEYNHYLDLSKEQDFSLLEKINFISLQGHDSAGRPIVMVTAAHLPVKEVNPETLLLYVIWKLDNIVSRDYALIFVQSGSNSTNRPTFSWLRKSYSLLNRKYKKNLKALYIVHPNFWVKTTTKLFKPFISQKFWQKLYYIEDIQDIYRFMSRDQIKFPEVVSKHESLKQRTEPIFGTPLEDVLARADHQNLKVPIIVEDVAQYLTQKNCNTIQGIFRLSGSQSEVQKLRKAYDTGGSVNLSTVEDPHIIAGLLKLYLREMPSPLFPFEMYNKLIDAYKGSDCVVTLEKLFTTDLPTANKALLVKLLEILAYIQEKSEENKMTSSNLSIVFAPNCIRSPKETMQQTVMHAPIINSIMRILIENHILFQTSLQQ